MRVHLRILAQVSIGEARARVKKQRMTRRDGHVALRARPCLRSPETNGRTSAEPWRAALATRCNVGVMRRDAGVLCEWRASCAGASV